MATMTVPMTLNEGMEAGLRVQVSKVIRAKRERVFAAWTKPEEIQKWFGPGEFTVPRVTNDLRVGGAYRIEMQGPVAGCANAPQDGAPVKTSVATGVYREIVPNEMISFTWQGSWTPGEETLVTVTLKDADGGTEVTIVHERFASVASMGSHEQGWTGSLAKLAGVLEG